MMNTILETAVKNKIATTLIDYLGRDNITSIPDTVEYPAEYRFLLKDPETESEIKELCKEYMFRDYDTLDFLQISYVITSAVFEKYFNDEFISMPFTIEQLRKALDILGVDIWDVLEMKYLFNM